MYQPIAARAPRCSFGRAATADGEQKRDQELLSDCPEQPPAPVPRPVLSRRAGSMFSGETGAVVMSGEGLATSRPTLKLVKEAFEVVNTLPSELFQQYAEHRPCGLLDKYAAVAMLIGDVLGLPVMPWILAEPIGKVAARLPGTISAETKKAKKAAQRKGKAVEEVAEAVLSRPVQLTFPQADVIARYWQQISKQTTSWAAPEPRASQDGTTAAVIATTTATRAAAHALPPVLVPGCCIPEVVAACQAANEAECALNAYDAWLPEFRLEEDEEYQDEKLEMQYKMLEYKRALQRLEHAAPELGVVAKEDCKGHQAAGPMCPCRSGGRVAVQGYPPWLLQTEELGFCAATCECGRKAWEMRCAITNGFSDPSGLSFTLSVQYGH